MLAGAAWAGMFQNKTPFVLLILCSAILTYSGFNSIPIKFLLFFLQTMPVVPAPAKQSTTTPSFGHPARIHGNIKSSGNVAKCAPLNGFVVTVQTECLLRKGFSSPFNLVASIVFRFTRGASNFLLVLFLFLWLSGAINL